jgi:hypothetical protein
VWEPLLAVADAAGGQWPTLARVAAVTLVAQSKESSPSLGVRLLADLHQVFADHEALTTRAILDALAVLDEAPWGDIKGSPIDSRRLANYLRPYGVQSTTIRDNTTVVRGYKRESLHDAWVRYLPQSSKSATSVTSVTSPYIT